MDCFQQVGLHPTAEQIELFAYHLPKATLSNLIVSLSNTVKPVLSDHMKLDICLAFIQVVANCCMKVVQQSFLCYFNSAISNHLYKAISMSPE